MLQKKKLHAFRHRRSDTKLPAIRINGASFGEATRLDRLLDLKLTPDLKWNSYILSVAKDVGKNDRCSVQLQ